MVSESLRVLNPVTRDHLQAWPCQPRVLVNASAIGFYGTSATDRYVESSSSGTDFLASLCQRWEAAAAAVPAGTRLVTVRIGIVLAADGGALGKMLPVFRTGFGGPIGSGQQWMSWIHRSDLCALIGQALEKEGLSGVINAVAPEPVSMAAFPSRVDQSVPGPGTAMEQLFSGSAGLSERWNIGFSS